MDVISTVEELPMADVCTLPESGGGWIKGKEGGREVGGVPALAIGTSETNWERFPLFFTNASKPAVKRSRALLCGGGV